MTKRVLLVAPTFPPVLHSSGLQRTLTFATHLRPRGWAALVLTMNPRALPAATSDQLYDVPDDVVVKRAFALDTARHLSLWGRYPRLLARPDRYSSWIPAAIWAGRRLVRQYEPRVIWSTYPSASVHVVGRTLARMSGLPWIADFRDPMINEAHSSDSTKQRDLQRIEYRVVHEASAAIFTTNAARELYRQRYPQIHNQRWEVIPNGFDEALFSSLERDGEATRPITPDRPVQLTHSGVLYPSERNPRPFFEALSKLKRAESISARRIRIVLRATGHDHVYGPMLEQFGISDLVELVPAIAYRDALIEFLQSDGLLLFQGQQCNTQIPAKLYEYLRAKRPILALSDRHGETATTLRNAGIDSILPIDSPEVISRGLLRFLTAVETQSAPIASGEILAQYSRERTAHQLADLLDELDEQHINERDTR